MIAPLDSVVAWSRRHPRVLAFLAAACFVYGGIQSNLAARDAAHSSKATATFAKNLAKNNQKQIDRLVAQRDIRRHAIDVATYKAALAGCRRQNVAREATNDIAKILKNAFAPANAAIEKAKRNGTAIPKTFTPLVIGLAKAAQKLKIVPTTRCLQAIPNPDEPANPHG